MRNYSYSPSPYSSQRHSRSSTPKQSHHHTRSKTSTTNTKPINTSSFELNFNKLFHNVVTALIFFFVIVYIWIVSMALNPPSQYCTTKYSSFCKQCPHGANCTVNNFTCLDESQVKFFEICHLPGNFFKEENLSLLYKYQSLLYNFVENHKGHATVKQAIEANLHLENEPSVNLSANDIEIIWTYDKHYYIDDNGFLLFRPSTTFLVTLFSIFYFILFFLFYIIAKHFLA